MWAWRGRAAAIAGGLLAVLLSLQCARQDPTGRACTKADECGPGFDCYQLTCVHVCAAQSECPAGTTCTRYRCLADAQAASPLGPPANDLSTPPPPDAIAAELRAIRRELEIVRREQQRLTELVEGKASKPATTSAPPVAPQKRTGIR